MIGGTTRTGLTQNTLFHDQPVSGMADEEGTDHCQDKLATMVEAVNRGQNVAIRSGSRAIGDDTQESWD
jgi:hypothetical protein